MLLTSRSCHAAVRKCQRFVYRGLSTSTSLVDVNLNETTKIATLSLNRPPVNSLNLELCQDISNAIKQIESTKAQGLILNSTSSTFSAGLDLVELHQPNEDRLAEFWTALQQVYLDLYGSRLATVAALNGAAPAAGCMLAMACDYRIAAKNNPKAVIGLNEAQFGIVAPPWMADLMLKTVGHRQAEINLMTGALFPPKEALEIGLVDQVVDDVEKASEQHVLQLVRIPHHSRAASKLLLRKAQLDHVESSRQEDLELFLSICLSDRVQSNLGAYLESLKSKSK